MQTNKYFKVVLLDTKPDAEAKARLKLVFSTLKHMPRNALTRRFIQDWRYETKRLIGNSSPSYKITILNSGQSGTTSDNDNIDILKRVVYLNRCHIRANRYPRLCYTFDGLTNDEMSANRYLKRFETQKTRRIFENKTPKTKAKHIGIEIEFVSSKTQDELAQAFLTAGMADYVCLKEDGSIRESDNYRYAHEIVVLGVQGKDIENKVKAVCAIIEPTGRVNKSCGLHVHLDMRNRDAEKSWKALKSMQKWFFAMQPASRRKNTYCKATRRTDFRRAKWAKSRYYAINAASLRKHNTIEIRCHSSTLDPVKINNWVALLVATVENGMERAPRSVSAIEPCLKISKDLMQYVKSRVDKFKDVTTESEAA